jgi:hypothetical protein
VLRRLCALLALVLLVLQAAGPPPVFARGGCSACSKTCCCAPRPGGREVCRMSRRCHAEPPSSSALAQPWIGKPALLPVGPAAPSIPEGVRAVVLDRSSELSLSTAPPDPPPRPAA